MWFILIKCNLIKNLTYFDLLWNKYKSYCYCFNEIWLLNYFVMLFITDK